MIASRLLCVVILVSLGLTGCDMSSTATRGPNRWVGKWRCDAHSTSFLNLEASGSFRSENMPSEAFVGAAPSPHTNGSGSWTHTKADGRLVLEFRWREINGTKLDHSLYAVVDSRRDIFWFYLSDPDLMRRAVFKKAVSSSDTSP